MTNRLNTNREINDTNSIMYMGKDLQIPKIGKIYSRTYCRIPVTMFLIKLVLFNDPRD